MNPTIFMLDPNSIRVGGRLRYLDEGRLADLLGSAKMLGIKTPISVRLVDGNHKLVAGLHRLEAARRLGIQVPCVEDDADELDSELWEISENLHHAELSSLDRADHVARWIDLTAQKAKAQLAPSGKPHTGGRSDQGINAAARDLGIDRTEAQRAVKIASLTPEAKDAARDGGLADNASALLQASRAPAPQQADAIRDMAAEKARPRQRSAPQYVVKRPEGADLPLEERMTVLQRAFRDDLVSLIRRHLAAEFPAEDAGGAVEILEVVAAMLQAGEINAAAAGDVA